MSVDMAIAALTAPPTPSMGSESGASTPSSNLNPDARDFTPSPTKTTMYGLGSNHVLNPEAPAFIPSAAYHYGLMSANESSYYPPGMPVSDVYPDLQGFDYNAVYYNAQSWGYPALGYPPDDGNRTGAYHMPGKYSKSYAEKSRKQNFSGRGGRSQRHRNFRRNNHRQGKADALDRNSDGANAAMNVHGSASNGFGLGTGLGLGAGDGDDGGFYDNFFDPYDRLSTSQQLSDPNSTQLLPYFHPGIYIPQEPFLDGRTNASPVATPQGSLSNGSWASSNQLAGMATNNPHLFHDAGRPKNSKKRNAKRKSRGKEKNHRSNSAMPPIDKISPEEWEVHVPSLFEGPFPTPFEAGNGRKGKGNDVSSPLPTDNSSIVVWPAIPTYSQNTGSGPWSDNAAQDW